MFARRREPAPAIEIGEHDAAPVNAFGEAGIAVNMNAHDDRAALLDFADFAEGDVVAETGHQFRLQVQRAQVASGDARQHEKNHGADEQRADGDQRGR